MFSLQGRKCLFVLLDHSQTHKLNRNGAVAELIGVFLAHGHNHPGESRKRASACIKLPVCVSESWLGQFATCRLVEGDDVGGSFATQ